MKHFIVPYEDPHFNLPFCVTSGQVFRWNQIAESTWFGVDGKDWYRVEVASSLLRVDSSQDQSAFRRLFSLDEPLYGVMEQFADAHPELGRIIGEEYGIRPMQPSDPVEVLFSFMCTSNNNVKRISGMVQRLSQIGKQIDEVCDEVAYAFPDPSDIASIGPEALRLLGFGYRAKYICQSAERICELGGRPWVENLSSGSMQEARHGLMALPGIGRKLADCICLYGLGFGTAVPIDVHLWNFMTRHYFAEWRGMPITDNRYEAIGDFMRDEFGSMAGFAHQLFFVDELLHWRSRR